MSTSTHFPRSLPIHALKANSPQTTPSLLTNKSQLAQSQYTQPTPLRTYTHTHNFMQSTHSKHTPHTTHSPAAHIHLSSVPIHTQFTLHIEPIHMSGAQGVAPHLQPAPTRTSRSHSTHTKSSNSQPTHQQAFIHIQLTHPQHIPRTQLTHSQPRIHAQSKHPENRI